MIQTVKEYTSPYLTRGQGWQPPYQPGEAARQGLNLPKPRNPGTAVRRIKVKSGEPLRGPRAVKGGTGIEYYRIGGGLNDKNETSTFKFI